MATYLDRTQSAGNRKTFTISAWVKRVNRMGTYTHLFTAGPNPGAWDTLRFDNNDQLAMRINNDSAAVRTNRVFRDPNAWYHIVAAIDTTQSTASDRVKLYVNGVQETSLSLTSYPSQNHDCSFNNNSLTLRIGDATWSPGSQYLDGLMSHVHFSDGYALAPTVFGSTNSTTGEWEINTSPSFTPGTNGFTILKDGNTITDQSANSNNFSLASGTLTKTEDNPSNVFATLNGAFNLSDNVLSNGNNKVVNANSNWKYVPATLGASSGKWYAEYKNTIGSGYLMVGVVDMQYAVSQDQNSYTHSGAGTGSVSIYSANGEKYLQGSNTTYAASYGSGSIIGVALDMDNSKVYFSKNGAWANGSGGWGSSTFDAAVGAITLPTTGTYTFALSQRSGAYNETNFGNGYFGTTAVATNSGNGYAGAEGSSIFNYQPPTGYSALSTKGLNT